MGARRDLDTGYDTFPGSKYSGKESEAFWRRINRIKDKRARSAAYEIGCGLQDHEYRALRTIELLCKDIKSGGRI